MPEDYSVYVINNNGNRITEIKNFVHTHLSGNTYHKGNIIQITRRLSSFNTCQLRLAKEDPMFTQFPQYPNIVQPWQFGIEVTHQGGTIFKGNIVNNAPYRRQRYIDVNAYGFPFRLDKKLVNRDPVKSPPDGSENYRTFKTGTMADAVRAIITEAQAACPSSDPIQKITFGSIVNPPFPSGFVRADGVTALTGAWTFSDDMQLQFDYKSILYILRSFAVYAQCDFEITDNYVLNFGQNIGVDHSKDVVFEFGPRGQIFDYNVPLAGERQVNSLWGIATDNNANVLHLQQNDNNSISQNGILLEGVLGFTDAKDANTLQSRTTQELNLIAQPSSVINVYLNRKAYPFANYDVGDLCTIKINDGPVQFNGVRRITAISLDVRDTGTEFITIETNPPLPGQV